MGWASGSSLARVVIRAALRDIPDDKARARFYRDFVRGMDQHDWDTQYEAAGIDAVFDRVLRRMGYRISFDDE